METAWRSGERRAAQVGSPGVGVPPLWESLATLYREYCGDQARRLVRMMPREAVRPLYRRAREWAAGRPGGSLGGELRELELLEVYCREELLPLPPFETWARDYLLRRERYLAALDRAPGPAREGDPVDVDLRELEWEGTAWTATLRLRRRDGEWRGAVAFRRPSDAASALTGEVLREPTSLAVRRRFRALGEETLRAFLRSAYG